MKYDALIIGGGAAGSYCAVTAAKMGKRVAVIEKNDRIGRKLFITGKGRCNLTNNCTVNELFDNIPVNPKFLYSAFSQCNPQDIMEYFESAGVALKTERGNRVFPVSDKAGDIVSALERQMRKYKVDTIHDSADNLIIEEGICKGVNCRNGDYYAESVVVATGGKSYPLTGSTGDGYGFAQQAGHTVAKLVPSLVPIVTEEKYCRDMMGLSLKNIKLSLYDNGKRIYSEQGEMLFTHFGISGPLVLSASSHIRKMQQGRYTIKIDLKPALSAEQLDLRIQRDFAGASNRIFVNSLGKLLPHKLIHTVVKLTEIPLDTKVNLITKQQRLKLLDILKNFPLTVKDFRPIDEAIITSGGVSVKEINPKTMESKLVKGLYFAGEIIDVDAYTGGFNLQIAFSTGYLAGMNV